MKNLRELFSYFDCCPVCSSQNKDFSVYYSKYPMGKTHFSINKKYIVLSFNTREFDYDYKMYIDLDSNQVEFGEAAFGPLSGGDYIFSVACSDCKMLRYEAYSYYQDGKIKEPRMLNESISVADGDCTFELETNHLSGKSVLIYSNKNSTISGFQSNRVWLPLIKLSSLPTHNLEKLLTKFKNFLLLS